MLTSTQGSIPLYLYCTVLYCLYVSVKHNHFSAHCQPLGGDCWHHQKGILHHTKSVPIKWIALLVYAINVTMLACSKVNEQTAVKHVFHCWEWENSPHCILATQNQLNLEPWPFGHRKYYMMVWRMTSTSTNTASLWQQAMKCNESIS